MYDRHGNVSSGSTFVMILFSKEVGFMEILGLYELFKGRASAFIGRTPREAYIAT